MGKNGFSIKLHQIIIPIIIGIGVVCVLFYKDISDIDFSELNLSNISMVTIATLVISVCCREFGYMWRYRILSDNDLSWWKTFKVTMLCEFSSTITPSSVGGSSLAMLFMNRDGISIGRGTAIVLITLFLDELFFVISCLVIYFAFPVESLFGTLRTQFSIGIKLTFWIIYFVIALWTLILFVGIVSHPNLIYSLLIRLSCTTVFKRWRTQILSFSNNLIETSEHARRQPFAWWLKSFMATVLSWCSRYLLVCVLFWGFVPGSDLFVVFARQTVVWLILIVTPTPGGSGVSEWLFSVYYSDMLPSTSMALVLALIWRVCTYYIYLFVGLLVIPGWLKSKSEKSSQR